MSTTTHTRQIQPFPNMKTLLHVLFLFCFANILVAQQETPSLFGNITATEGARLVLETDLDVYQDNRKTADQFPGMITLADGSIFKVNLSVRGKFRRMSCKYPPLKVKVPKKALLAAGLDTLNELKLMLPFDDSKASGEWLVKEYLSYRMFEQLSPNSVRARLLQLTLKDSRTGKSNTMMCVAVEDKEETLARLQGTLVETYGITEEQLDTDQYALMAVFQYMIGNTDWQVDTYRNVRLVKISGNEKLLVLPYDLDFSGMVNPAYARPSLDYNLASITDRYFMAQSLNPEIVRSAVQRFVQARTGFYSLCQSPILSPKAAREMTGYLDSFYKQITPDGDLRFSSAEEKPASGTAK